MCVFSLFNFAIYDQSHAIGFENCREREKTLIIKYLPLLATLKSDLNVIRNLLSRVLNSVIYRILFGSTIVEYSLF